MPECPKCNAPVPVHARLCPDCGAPVLSGEPPAQKPSPHDDAVHALLLNAHLLKIRGDSESAIDECIKALRINPDSVEAHSLLGDIHKSQGKIEEAVHWYKLALDLSPESQLNKERLGEITPREIAARKSQSSTERLVSFLKRHKLVTAEALGILIFVMIMGLVLRGPNNHPGQQAQSPSGGHGVAPQTPVATTPVTPRIESRIEERTPVTTDAADSESRFVDLLNTSQPLRDYGLRVVSATMDPRYDFATISFATPNLQDGLTVDAVVKNSFVVMKTAFGLDNSPSNITIRALYSSSSGPQTQLVFVADSSRDQASRIDPETSSYEDTLSALTNIWYHPDLAPEKQ